MKISTPAAMAVALKEEWESITIGEINQEIVKLPKVMENCIRQSGGNKFQAQNVFSFLFSLFSLLYSVQILPCMSSISSLFALGVYSV